MTKPATVALWATDAAYSGGTYNGETNKATPGATLIAQGWEPNVKPTAQNFNQRFNLIGQWCQYLNDGAFEGASTFNSTLGVTGAVLMSSTLGVTGAVLMSSTLGVTGAVLMSSTLGVTGLITATAGVTCAANQHVTVSGTGKHKHGDKKITQSPESTAVVSGTYVVSVSSNAVIWTLSATTGVVMIPIRALHSELRIKAITVFASAANEPTIVVYDQVEGNSASVATTTSAGPITSTDKITHTLDTPITPADGELLYVKVSAGSSTVIMRQIMITFDYP